jgi:hypothetical protein
VVDLETKRVQVVPRAVDPDQQRVQLAPQLQHLSRAVAEAAPKRSKNSAGCAIEKTIIHIFFRAFVPQHSCFVTFLSFSLIKNNAILCLLMNMSMNWFDIEKNFSGCRLFLLRPQK